MPVQRRRLADIDHELERNFLNLSELKSNKRRRSENKNSSIGNMVKTMAVIPTHRKSSGGKANHSKKTTRSTFSSKTGRTNCVSPGLDSSTAYDPSTSPTYYTSSTVASGSRAKQRNCSPLPTWLANTFSGLVRNHPLRLLLPGNPSPPASPSPAVYRRPSLPRPPSVRESSRNIARRPSSPPPNSKPRPRKKARTKENKIFAYDPFETVEDEGAAPLPQQDSFETVDLEQQHTDNAGQASPHHLWSTSAEKYYPEQQPEQRTKHHDPTPPLEPTYSATQELPYDYASPITLAPPAPAPIGSPPNFQLDEYENIMPDSPPSWHRSTLSVPLGYNSPADELPGSQYVAQLYKTRGPASTIEIPPPRPCHFYFDSPTEDPYSSPFSPTNVSALAPHYSETQAVFASTQREPQFPAPHHAQPLITPITKPCVPDGPLQFSWKKFDRNSILAQRFSETKKPIYQLPPSDDDDYSEISSVLPSLLLGPGNLARAPQTILSDNDEQTERANRNPYETPAPSVISNAPCGQGPRLFRPSQSSSQLKSDKALTNSPAVTVAHQTKTLQTGTHAPPSTPIQRGAQVLVKVVSTPARLEEDVALEVAGEGEDNGEAKTPKSSAIFAPAPGIYISPLRGSDTSNETAAKEAAKRPDSQSSHDSIQSWSDRL